MITHMRAAFESITHGNLINKKKDSIKKAVGF